MTPNPAADQRLRALRECIYRASHRSHHPRMYTPGATAQAKRLAELLQLAMLRTYTHQQLISHVP